MTVRAIALRLPEARAAQAELARANGIEGFCYYHYWFNGRRLIERPFNEVLASGQPDFPFCLCWANETWSRRWLGEERDILMEQTYSPEDDVRHAQWTLRAWNEWAEGNHLEPDVKYGRGYLDIVKAVTSHPLQQ